MTQYGRPVLATPAAPLEVRLAGLMRFQPVTARRAMYRRVMRLLMRFGVDHWFADEAESPIDPATGFDFPGWLDQASADVGQPGAIPSVMWPTRLASKRFYVHLFDPAVRPIGFAKVSYSDENDRRLEHEAQMLRRLADMNLQHCHVPRVLADRVWRGHRYLILEPIPPEATPVVPAVYPFPREVSGEFGGDVRTVPGDQVPALSWWEKYLRRLQPEHSHFAEELDALACEGVRVKRAHGDFGLNNIVTVNGKPWVFDWEEACDDAPAATDEVAFWVIPRYRGIARPRTLLRQFAERFLDGADRQRRCDVMMALAFRFALGMPSAPVLFSHWARVRGQAP